MTRWRYLGLPSLALAAILGLVVQVGAESSDSKPGKSEYAFDQAIQDYLKGDSSRAIEQLDEALTLNPNNERAKIFLLKILVERGSRLFLAKQYSKAYAYLSRAYHMDPNNVQVRQMFDIAAKQVKPQTPIAKVMLIPKQMQEELLRDEARLATQAQGAPEVTLATSSRKGKAAKAEAPAPSAASQVTAMYAEPAPMEAAAGTGGGADLVAQEYAKNVSAMMELMATFQRQQERQLTQFMAPLERIQNLYYQSEEERKNFMNQLDGRFKSLLGNVSFQQRMVVYGFAFGLMILGMVVWGFWLIIGRMRSKREELIMKYQQEMLKMVRDMACLPGSGYGALPGGFGGPRLPAAASSQVLIGPGAAPLAPGEGQDPLEVLDQTLQNGNYKERALAAMKMLYLDANRAADVIKGMIMDPDPFLRENMAFALGEHYHPLTLELLLAAVQDGERRVSDAALRALRRLEGQTEETLTESARQQILLALKQATQRKNKKAKG